MAIAIRAEGDREILCIVAGAKEDRGGRSSFLKHLTGRGLKGVRRIVSDACLGAPMSRDVQMSRDLHLTQSAQSVP